MESITIRFLDRIVVTRNRRLALAQASLFKKQVRNTLASFGVETSINQVEGDRGYSFVASIKGESDDVEAARNFLKLKFGIVQPVSLMKAGDRIPKARLNEPGSVGFGVFFDIGADTGKNALYPLYRIREQLVEGHEVPARSILKFFGFCSNFGFPVVVTGIEEGTKISVELADEAVTDFKAWVDDGLERVFCHGETGDRLEKLLAASSKGHDHVTVQETGFLDAVLTCDRRTNGAGIVSMIGPRLSHVQMGVFVPESIKKLLE
jgi:hypothetical protein